MASYRNRTTGQLTTLSQAQAAFPNISFGSTLSAADYTLLNIDPVLPSARPPLPQMYDTLKQIAPVQGTDGNWYQAWQVVDPTVGATDAQLTAIKTTIAAKLTAKFNANATALIAGGFNYNFAGYSDSNDNPCGVLTLQMDQNSQINWLGLNLMAMNAVQAGSTTPIPIRTMQNINVLLPPTTLIAVLAGAGNWKSLVILTTGALKDQLTADVANAAITPLQMVTIVWPESALATPQPPVPTPTPSPTPTPTPSP